MLSNGLPFRPNSEEATEPVTNGIAFRSLVDGFLESVERFPSRQAVLVDGEYLSYLDLSEEAGRIADAILKHERGRFPLAALFAHRSKTAYAGVLGILAAGKGYVPLNPRFPAERTRRMLELSLCETLIVGKEALPQLTEILPKLDRRLTVILPDTFGEDGLSSYFPQHQFVSAREISGGGELSFRPEVSPNNVAYLMFTSGSTGQPKGVPISQSNVRSYIQYVCDRYDVTETDRFSQEFDLTFDLSVHDMFVCWERGACLFSVPAQSVMAPAKFIRQHQLTMWFSVPSVAGVLGKMRLLPPGCFPSLRYSLFCGEPLSAAYAQLWQEAASNSILENLYGPTEATIAISHYRWDKTKSPEQCVNGIVPIGLVFDGQHCSIVDDDRQTVSANNSGELCLSGSQLTAGYWNEVRKTREQFFQAGAGGRTWYRTGDLVRQDSNGCLHYLGRVDHQVKIRGYRVELQEIEVVLRRVCGVEQAVALAWPVENGSAAGVVAFVSGAKAFDCNHILAYCREVLPDYMAPKAIYPCDEMPLNANGKIDRLSLLSLLKEQSHAATR